MLLSRFLKYNASEEPNRKKCYRTILNNFYHSTQIRWYGDRVQISYAYSMYVCMVRS